MKKYAIVCSSRTGSSYLCKLLSATNRCGYPQEFFNPEMGFSPCKHELMRNFLTNNNVFGVKIVGIDQWKIFRTKNIQINYWIYLTRKDEVLQAISRYIAFTTNNWESNKKNIPEYSYEDINWCFHEVRKEKRFFDNIFADKSHIKLEYETDIEDNTAQTIISLLDNMNISIEEIPELPLTKKPHYAILKEWRDKFAKDFYYHTMKELNA